MDIRGLHGHEVWVEGASDIDAEYYASIILDRSEKKLLAMLSRMGGMDIEEIAETDPDALIRRHIEPGEELDRRAGRADRDRRRIDEDVTDQVAEMLVKLHEVALAEDATLIEVNPLIVTADREVVALDSKVTIDNNALYRHEELAELARPLGRGPAGGDGRRRRASPTSSSAATSASSATAPGSACRRSTWSPRRAASRPTSSTPAAARRRRRSSTRSR